MAEVTIAELVDRLRASRKYEALCGETLTRAASWAAARHPRVRDAEKAAKRKLHQISAAYVGSGSQKIAERTARWSGEEEETFCREVMSMHASTGERLPIIDGLFPTIFDVTGSPDRVLDLACGLNALSLPWMDPGRTIDYAGIECDGHLASAAGDYLAKSRRSGAVRCGDILGPDPLPDADLTFLLKSIPCLNQQEPGSARALLSRLEGRQVVVSYPGRSLGGREKGMRLHYEAEMDGIVEGLPFDVERIPFAEEAFYVLLPQGPSRGG